MSYQVKTEKLIEKSASDVFHALKGGLLFMNCGADSNSIKIDFRVGGKYQINFKGHSVSNHGEFLEIIPNKKIVFSWCQTFGADQKPDTTVTIELFEDGNKTRLQLLHTGFHDKKVCDDHNQGWNSGMTDLGEQIQSGRLRFVRNYPAPVEKLFDVCKNPASFFSIMGDVTRASIDFNVGGKFQVPTEKGQITGSFLEIIPNKKISFTWLSNCSGPISGGSKVTLLFSAKEDGGSSLELLHEGLSSEDDQKSHRQGWEVVTEKMKDFL